MKSIQLPLRRGAWLATSRVALEPILIPEANPQHKRSRASKILLHHDRGSLVVYPRMWDLHFFRHRLSLTKICLQRYGAIEGAYTREGV